jgi:hypothetical protein
LGAKFLAQNFWRKNFSVASLFEHFVGARCRSPLGAEVRLAQSVAIAPRASFVTREGTISQRHSGRGLSQ